MSLRFLVIDDDFETRNMMSTILGSFECAVESVASGEEAMALLSSPERAGSFDAVFIDYNLPGISGLEVLAQAKAMSHNENLPLIMLTASDNDTTIVDAYSKGADYYITKPFTSKQLQYGLDLLFGEDAAD